MHAQRVYHESNLALAMITTAFLIKVIIYGLVAAVIIPAIDFMMFVIRESRRPGSLPVESSSEEWASRNAAPSQAAIRGAAVARQKKQQWEEALAEVDRTPRREYAGDGNGRAPASAERRAPANAERMAPASAVRRADSWPTERVYVASNGVTITPGPGAFHGGLMDTSCPSQPLVSTSGHPHAEYWTYGSPRFYEHR